MRSGAGSRQAKPRCTDPRFTIRTLMIAVLTTGLILGLIRSVRVHVHPLGAGATAAAIDVDFLAVAIAGASLAGLVGQLRPKAPNGDQQPRP
jgi:hypothetical protein